MQTARLAAVYSSKAPTIGNSTQDVTVRYVEDMGGIHLTIEGSLPATTIATLVDDLRTKLASIDGTPHSTTRLA